MPSSVRESEPLFLSRSLRRVTICRASGRLAAPGCSTLDEWFRPAEVPKNVCPLHGGTLAHSPAGAPRAPAARLESPTPELHLAMDPRIPDDKEAFPLTVTATPGFERVEWFLDGELLATTAGKNFYPWPLRKGRHEAHARVWFDSIGPPVETQSVRFLVK